MRICIRLGIMLIGLFCSAAARADSIYTLKLTSSTNGASGSGTFSINVAPSATGKTTYTAGSKGAYVLDAFSVSVGGYVFDLGTTLTTTSVVFTNGQLSGITYGASIGSTAFQTSGLSYALITIGTGNPAAMGTITATAVPAATATAPEPTSLALLGSGMLGVIGVMKRRAGWPLRT